MLVALGRHITQYQSLHSLYRGCLGEEDICQKR
jgi:hypothetical protein